VAFHKAYSSIELRKRIPLFSGLPIQSRSLYYVLHYASASHALVSKVALRDRVAFFGCGPPSSDRFVYFLLS
jgi:hypothetical protein